MPSKKELTVAYFTMEIGLKSEMPTFAGGLGMLAADILRSCSDLKVKSCGITVAWQHGYLHQEIHEDGTQTYSDITYKKEDHLQKLDETVEIELEGRTVTVGCWQYDLKSGKHVTPVYFLDTDLPENEEQDRHITNHLYGGDGYMRIKQEAVLGIAGVRMLRALGYNDVKTYHMNEGHAAFLTLELLKERDYDDQAVKKSCAFTTHTPVKAGHDAFGYDMVYPILGDMLPWHIRDLAGQDELSMTHLAMHLSSYTCGVSQIHGDVSRKMFPGEDIDAITNGVHHTTWASPEMAALFDEHAEGWREDPSILSRVARDLPDEKLWNAHMAAKKRLVDYVNDQTNAQFDTDSLIITQSRRVVPYKRPELFYKNIERLREICDGKVQIIHAGNAHPGDAFSMGVIQRMVERSQELKDSVRIAYLENYNPDLAKKLVSGSDIWLNTPKRLYEASGTSGMKAALNGVLNLSTLDGWWIEAYGMEHEAGWRIGPLVRAVDEEEHRKIDAEDIYTQMQYEIIPEYYYRYKIRWIRRMKRSIGLLGFFNTHRCVKEYLDKAWQRY